MSEPRGHPGRLKVGWIGFHQEGVAALQAVLASGYRVQALFTLERDLAARKSGAADYRALCLQFGVPLHEVRTINDSSVVERLCALQLDVVFVIGWTQVLRPEVLRTARLGMIGAHASLLPHGRGRAPVNWALIKGAKQTGNTLFWLDARVDCGALIEQAVIPISRYDTCATVYEKVAASNRDMILRVLPQLAAGVVPGAAQPEIDEPPLPGRVAADGVIDWSHSSRQVYDLIRAVTRPYPGAFTSLDGERLRVWHAALLPGSCGVIARPGTVLGPVVSPVDQACGQAVACGDGTLVLLEIERESGQLLAGRLLSELPWHGRTLGK